MKIILFSVIILFTFSVNAADTSCSGPIAMAMSDHSGCTDSNGKRQMAFKINSTSNPWMCTNTDLASSMILSAVMAKKNISVWISDEELGKTCTTITSYSKVSYIIFYQ